MDEPIIANYDEWEWDEDENGDPFPICVCGRPWECDCDEELCAAAFAQVLHDEIREYERLIDDMEKRQDGQQMRTPRLRRVRVPDRIIQPLVRR